MYKVRLSLEIQSNIKTETYVVETEDVIFLEAVNKAVHKVSRIIANDNEV